MNRSKIATAALILLLPAGACTSYSAYQKAQTAERSNNWDDAVTYYEKALDVDPGNAHYKLALTRARLAASRVHFQKGKSLRAAALQTTGGDQYRLAQLAATELELTVKLDTTNQYAASELDKAITLMRDVSRAADNNSVDEMKKRVKANISKAQPPVLNPASDQPISLNFSHETPVKDIYRALGNAFGINILYDQAVKDDRISIELKDVTAQQALERVMQAANHFYKVLDEHTIIVVPDNPQARRDYEDLVIRTFYLSNGDAEQVTNVVRTMIEARNVFPLKALNAITIRDTADKVRIAEKIIEANDKAKAEVVVDVELLQLDATKLRDIGATFGSYSFGAGLNTPQVNDPTDTTGVKKIPGPISTQFLRDLNSTNLSFTIPSSVTVNLIKNATDSEQLANPQLRISEGEKATLHIGKRIPVPVSTFSSVNTTGTGNTFAPVTSFQYQDVGIKVSIEPRVHHNREVTLKLTVEVSDQSGEVRTGDNSPPQPIISTRTIESTIRLKDGETNFLAGLIQRNDTTSEDRPAFFGDLPIIGRLFNHEKRNHNRTDLMLTMTPHIVRIPDITEDDLAPMWVGTTNNLTFRGVSPRIESQAGIDPFNSNASSQNSTLQLSSDGEPGNYIQPEGGRPAGMNQTPLAPAGSGPTDVFRSAPNAPPPPPPPGNPEPQVRNDTPSSLSGAGKTAALRSTSISDSASVSDGSASVNDSSSNGTGSSNGSFSVAPRIAPQPTTLAIKTGEEKIWNVVGMDLEGLTTRSISMHFDPRTLNVVEVMFGPALAYDPRTPPVATINSQNGTIRIVSSDGKPLSFTSGGEVAMLRVHGGGPGESFLVMDSPELRNRGGQSVASAISGGRLRVQ